MRKVLALATGLVLLTACGGGPDVTVDGSTAASEPAATTSSTPDQTPTGVESDDPEREQEDLDRPPPLLVETAETSVAVDAFTYCFGNVCADGVPAEPLPDVGTGDEVRFTTDLADWTFTADLREPGERFGCGRAFPAAVRADGDGDGVFVVEPAGPAGTYDVTVSGRAPAGGDLFAAFRWTTTEDGPTPTPVARAAVVAENDGLMTSYGVEFTVQHLAEVPADAAVTMTVTAAGGESTTFDVINPDLAEELAAEEEAAEEEPTDPCFPDELFLRGDRTDGEQAAALGDPPFTYVATLTLDGETYTGTGTWPDDTTDDITPAVPLTFTPPLPAWSPSVDTDTP